MKHFLTIIDHDSDTLRQLLADALGQSLGELGAFLNADAVDRVNRYNRAGDIEALVADPGGAAGQFLLGDGEGSADDFGEGGVANGQRVRALRECGDGVARSASCECAGIDLAVGRQAPVPGRPASRPPRRTRRRSPRRWPTRTAR